jgi:hypothetical protein
MGREGRGDDPVTAPVKPVAPRPKGWGADRPDRLDPDRPTTAQIIAKRQERAARIKAEPPK